MTTDHNEPLTIDPATRKSIAEVTINGVVVAAPNDAAAYKYSDPIEDARWIYDEDEARQIASEDPSLIVWSEES